MLSYITYKYFDYFLILRIFNFKEIKNLDIEGHDDKNLDKIIIFI